MDVEHSVSPVEPPVGVAPSGQPVEPPAAAELRDLVRRAQAGEAAAVARIRDILDRHPENWQHVGDLSALVERAWVSVLSADPPWPSRR